MNRLRDNFKDIDFEPKNVKQIFFSENRHRKAYNSVLSNYFQIIKYFNLTISDLKVENIKFLRGLLRGRRKVSAICV